MLSKVSSKRELRDAYRFPGFVPACTIVGVFGDPRARIVSLTRRAKKQSAAPVAARHGRGTIANDAAFAICRVAIFGSISSSIYVGFSAGGAGV
ncbi:MAG: hypothetical protein ACT4P6_06915 [Gemmatimonadaceae bacterium]